MIFGRKIGPDTSCHGSKCRNDFSHALVDIGKEDTRNQPIGPTYPTAPSLDSIRDI
jgi:hypothetical protein